MFAPADPAATRAALLANLSAPATYAAAHLALLAFGGDPAGAGVIYGGTDAPAPWNLPAGFDAGDPDAATAAPGEWAGRLFYFGMEYGYGEDGGFLPVRPAEQAARLARLRRGYFAGDRNDFRVAPEPPASADPRAAPGDPAPRRRADDPLPAWVVPEEGEATDPPAAPPS